MTDNNSNNSPSEDRQCEEESAIFRAIPLQPGSLAPLQPLAPVSFSGLAPLDRKRSPELDTQATASSNSISSSSPSRWTVTAAEVPRVPDYPLEQTSLSMGRELSLEQITQRISHVLDTQGLVCCYSDDDEHDESDDDDMDDEEKLPGRVDCTSEDKDLKFVVQLYRNHDETICVEVQRRRGSSLDFSAVRRSLFQTLKTGQLQKAAPKKWTPPAFTPNKKFCVMPRSPLARS